MPGRRRTGSTATAALAVTLAGVLGGCSSFTTLTSSSSSTTASSSSANSTAAQVETARRLAASYNYSSALRLLREIPGTSAEVARIEQAKATAKRFPDNTRISHLFYHSLIVDPKRAFHSSMAHGYDDYMVTIEEFREQLQQLYDRGYVLIHPERIAAPAKDGTMTMKPIYLPPGKTPLVLSVDDVNYYEYMESDGFASRLTVDAQGKIVNDYTDDAKGTKHQGSFDVLPIVDDFVAEHPDFSYRGDKGTLGETGYNGVLGYRTSVIEYGDTDKTRSEIAAATKVAEAIKADGWRFASHSWGHINFTKDGVGALAADSQRWATEVQPIVGPTKEFIYPFGADISGVPPYTDANAKYRMLHDDFGFDYLFPIDASTPAWMQLSAGSLRQARINVDGLSMGRALKSKSHVLWDFFDVTKSIDRSRPSLR